MKTAARVIIKKGNKILFIHRIKGNKVYYVLPGGAIEKGETSEQTAIREVKEETNFNIVLDDFKEEIIETVNGEKRHGYYFLAKSYNGNLKLCGPEAEKQTATNQYLHEWISIDELDKLLIYPVRLKRMLFTLYKVKSD